MLTKDDLKQIKEIVVEPLEKRFDMLEEKVDKLSSDVEDLKLETQSIHEIIKNSK